MKTNPRRMKTIAFIVFSVLAVLVVGACSRHRDMDSARMVKTPAAYHCAMHPQIVSDKPGDCPICHMRLVPFQQPSQAAVAMSTTMAQESMDSGHAAVAMTDAVQQTIGVTVGTVEQRLLTRIIRASARVAYDPGLYSATLEHQQALDFLKQTEAHGSPELQDEARATVHSSELRLRQMGVVSNAGSNGSSDPESSSLIVGTSNGPLWVYASIFDQDAALIHRGQDVRLTTPAMPGEVFHGTVISLDPVLDSETRTLRVRIRVHDPQSHLKPEMFLAAEISAPMGRRLSIPSTAVLDTGSRQLVYVQTQPGRFEPREVHVGNSMENYDEVFDGLKEGDIVATAANFFIDSESRINAATEKALKKP